MKFEDILVQVGDYGKYQRKLTYLFLPPVAAMLMYSAMNDFFFVSVPDHWCNVPDLDSWNLTLDEEKQLVRPPGDPKCSMYQLNYTELFSSPTRNWTIPSNTPTTRCLNGWRYDKTYYERTAATQWNMVCDDSHYVSLVLTMASVGRIFGTPLYGILSDRVGRKPTFFLIVMVTCIAGVASVLVTDFCAFVALRTINGSIVPSMIQVPIIIPMEIVGPTMRTRMNGIVGIFCTIGLCVLPLVAWTCGDFVVHGLASFSLTAVLFAYWKFLPESPRWLLSQGRYDEAADILMAIAKQNGKIYNRVDCVMQMKKVGEQIEKEEEVAEGNEQASTLDLIKYPKLRKNFLILTSCWVATGAAYYGLQINVPHLGGNEFVQFFVMALVEIPGSLFAWFFMEKFGRRWCSVSTIMLTGLVLLVPVFYENADVVVSLIGKFGSSAGYTSIFQQGSELYPTVVRAQGMGLSDAALEVGVTTIPYIIYLAEYGKYIPFLVIAVACISSGMAASLLPETLNENLPQTILDGENFDNNQRFFSCKRRKRPLCYELASPKFKE